MKNKAFKVFSKTSLLLSLILVIGLSFTACADDIINFLCSHEMSSSWVVEKEPSTYEDGTKYRVCNDCKTILERASIPALGFSQEEIVDIVTPSVVKVISYDYDKETKIAQGSGFFIDNNGTFITNAHVIEDSYYVDIIDYLGNVYNVDCIISYNYTNSDFALCKASNVKNSAPLSFCENVEVGDAVYAFGYPNNISYINITSGQILKTSVIAENVPYFSFSAWVNHGNSGGVLVNNKGQAIGVVTGIFKEGEYAAIRYCDFKSEINKTSENKVTPLAYFQTETVQEIEPSPLEEYFDVFVNVVSYTDTSVDYKLSVKLKDSFEDKKIAIADDSIVVPVELETKYVYYEVGPDGVVERSKTTSEVIKFSLVYNSQLKQGKTLSADSYIRVPSEDNFHLKEISYEISFADGQSGKLLIYS